MPPPDKTTAPKIGEIVRYWLGNRERTGRVCYVDSDSFDVRWNYGGTVGTDTVRVRGDDWIPA